MLSVSIVTPSLNQGQFIEAAVQSVASQSGAEIEHFIVDGGSRDGTLDVLRKHESSVRWISEPDRGQANALNKGLLATSGEVIGWLSSDDVYYPEAIAKVCEYFETHPEADVLYADAEYIDEDGDVLGRYRTKDWSRRRIRRKCCLPMPAVFLRRRAVERCGRLNEDLNFWLDYDYWLRLDALGAQFVKLSGVLAGCRVHPENKYFWSGKVENHVIAARELLQVTVDRLGRASSLAVLNYARTMAVEDGLHQEDSIRFDFAALRHAVSAERQWNGRAWSLAPAALRLSAKHFGKEWKETVRNPHRVTRFLPAGGRAFVRTHLKRKIFKLKHHGPRPITRSAFHPGAIADSDGPRISIVTPNLNQGKFLEHTIRSVVEQDYPRLEYVVQDGGSSDDSVAVIQRHAKQLKHWQSAPDRGQAHAINLGMRHTTGEIMAYLNSDDLLLPGCLAYVARYFTENPDVDVVYGHRVLIDQHAMEIGRWILPRHDDKVLPWADYIPQETMFWRRRAWERVGGGLDESFQFAMDWDLILRFRGAGCKFQRLPRFLGAFRVLDDQKTNRLMETVGRLEMKRLRRRWLGRIPSNREMRRELRPYFWRHWWLDKLYSLGFAKF